tara:strand:- start:1367 stop:1594 length:228 start_codon:yes stop_codon:yes gene_type:complete
LFVLLVVSSSFSASGSLLFKSDDALAAVFLFQFLLNLPPLALLNPPRFEEDEEEKEQQQRVVVVNVNVVAVELNI